MDSQENSESNNIVDQADNKSLTESTITPVEWSRENEEILVEWCDVAQCYKWLNLRAHTKYSYLHAWFTIPAITLSTITGTASFAQSSLPTPYTYAPMLIGAVNIFIGILTTIQQYLKISELNEAHRVSMISWDKFSRNIRIELAKRSEERVEAGQFLKICRNEYDRLMESSPIIPDKVVQEFNEKFRGKEGSTKRKHFDKIRKPDICSTIISVSELLENENIIEDQSVLELADAKKNELISEQTQKIDEMARLIESQKQAKDNELAEKKRRVEHESRKTQERLEKSKQAMDKINTYIVDFKGVYDRDPIADEIENNVEVEEKYMKEFLSSYNV